MVIHTSTGIDSENENSEEIDSPEEHFSDDQLYENVETPAKEVIKMVKILEEEEIIPPIPISSKTLARKSLKSEVPKI